MMPKKRLGRQFIFPMEARWRLTPITIEEHRELAEPHNEHYDYLKYLETTSDSRIKTFKEWLMYEISKDYNEWFSAEEEPVK